MFRTRLCDILGIEYPIIQGGMVWICGHELAGAVSAAGGLGLLAAGSMMPDELEGEIEKLKKITDKPFGVNVPLLRPDAEELIDVSIAGGARAISTSAGSPKRFTGKIQEKGCAVMHVSPSVGLAGKGADAGVDILVAEGIEAGGHDGFDEITTMALVPQVVDRVKDKNVPVVAAGGVADARGFVAALALGASGVQIGTRFAATVEAKAHENFKNAIVDVTDTGTVVTARSIGPTRCIRNPLAERILEAEIKGATKEELFDLIGEGRSQKAAVDGDIQEGTVYCGQIGGMIHDIKTAKEVIDDIITGAKKLVGELGELG